MGLDTLVNLSATATIAGVGIDYAVVKDYCEKYELDVIDSFSLVKRIRNEMQS